jgi:hypothetical protein
MRTRMDDSLLKGLRHIANVKQAPVKMTITIHQGGTQLPKTIHVSRDGERIRMEYRRTPQNTEPYQVRKVPIYHGHPAVADVIKSELAMSEGSYIRRILLGGDEIYSGNPVLNILLRHKDFKKAELEALYMKNEARQTLNERRERDIDEALKMWKAIRSIKSTKKNNGLPNPVQTPPAEKKVSSLGMAGPLVLSNEARKKLRTSGRAFQQLRKAVEKPNNGFVRAPPASNQQIQAALSNLTTKRKNISTGNMNRRQNSLGAFGSIQQVESMQASRQPVTQLSRSPSISPAQSAPVGGSKSRAPKVGWFARKLPALFNRDARVQGRNAKRNKIKQVMSGKKVPYHIDKLTALTDPASPWFKEKRAKNQRIFDMHHAGNIRQIEQINAQIKQLQQRRALTVQRMQSHIGIQEGKKYVYNNPEKYKANFLNHRMTSRVSGLTQKINNHYRKYPPVPQQQ